MQGKGVLKFGYQITGLLALIAGIFFLTVQAAVIFSTEMDGVHSPVFHIDSGDTATDFIDLEFGSSLNARLRYDVLNNRFIFGKDVAFEKAIIDASGSIGSSGQVLTSDGSGQVFWQPVTGNSIPYISNKSPQMAPPNTTTTITYTGYNFTPNTTVTIPGFDGTIDQVQVVSPEELRVTITPGSTKTTYDVILSNAGVENTLWSGNEVGRLIISNRDGQSANTPGLTCKDILDNGFSVGDGTYWIDPNGGDPADSFQVYCDMTTDGGGWTQIPYAADFPHENHNNAGPGSPDTSEWWNGTFDLALSDQQINEIRALSTEGKQRYVGTCDGVIHYEYNGEYNYAFGFRFHNGDETAYEQQTYPNTNITVVQDGCSTNNSSSDPTIFDIYDVRVPVITIHSRDNGGTSELFGSPLTQNPAWLR